MPLVTPAAQAGAQTVAERITSSPRVAQALHIGEAIEAKAEEAMPPTQSVVGGLQEVAAEDCNLARPPVTVVVHDVDGACCAEIQSSKVVPECAIGKSFE